MKKTICYKRRGTEATLTLNGCVDIFEAQGLHAAALRALTDTEARNFCADLTGAERVDLSALQILAALRRDLEEAGRAVTVKKSEAQAAAWKRTGFSL